MAELVGSPETRQTDKDNGSLTSRARAYVASETRNLMEERGVNERMAERVDRYGRAVGIVRERIPADGSRTGAYLEDISTRLDQVGDSLREGDYRSAGQEVRKLANDHPELFVGLAFAAGAFLGRFARETIVENQGPEKGSSRAATRAGRNPPDIGPNVPPAAGQSTPAKQTPQYEHQPEV